MVVRNTFYNLISQIIIKALSFGFLIFVVRQLGSVEFGKYSIAVAFVGALMILSDLGLGPYVSREVARDPGQVENLLGNMIVLRFILALAFTVLATLLGWLLGYQPDIVFAIFLGSSSQLMFAVQSSLDAVLIGSQRLGASAFANLANQVVLVITGTVILLAGFGFLGLSVASLLGILAATLLNALTIRKRIGRTRIVITPRIWFKMLKHGLPFGINMFALSITYRLDSLILGWFWSTAVVGMYSAAYNLIFTLATLSNSINIALFPNMSRRYATNPEAVKQDFGKYMRYLLILSLPMATIGTVLAEPLAQFLFSKAYTETGMALRILVWVLPLMFINELFGYIAATMGLERQMATIRFTNAFANVSMNLVAIPAFGILGASVTTVITEAVGIIQFVVLFKGRGVFPATPLWLLQVGLPAGVAMLFGTLVSGFPVLLAGALSLTIYFAGLIPSRAIRVEELKLLVSAFSKRYGRARATQEQATQPS
jgi:O-antigen/teichoic acid export membrane protein